MAGLFDPPSIGGGGSVPTMPGAIPQAGFGANGGAFNDIQNLLSGNAGGQGFDMAGLNSGIQSLAYGIGSFAKNPQTRAAYIQAAQAHEQHKNSSADEDYRTLLGIAPQFMSLLKQVQGNPQAAAALKPMLDHYTQNLDIASRRAGKSGSMGTTLSGMFDAIANLPPELQPSEDAVGQVMDDLRNKKITQEQADARIKQLTGGNQDNRVQTVEGMERDPATGQWRPIPGYLEQKKAIAAAGRTGPAPDRTMVEIYDPSPDNPTHRKMIPRDQYAGQPTGVPQQPSMGDAMGLIAQKVQQGGIAALTDNDKAVINLNKEINPLAQYLANTLAGGGASPTTGASAAPGGTSAIPAPAAPAASTAAPGASKDAPLPVDNSNAETVVRGIIATGQPVWGKGPDGKVEQITPAQAKAWLKAHGLADR